MDWGRLRVSRLIKIVQLLTVKCQFTINLENNNQLDDLIKYKIQFKKIEVRILIFLNKLLLEAQKE